MGLRTINERINQLEAQLAQVHRGPIKEVPAVVQFDGIWLSMQTQQEGVHEDSRKRKRHRKRGKRIVVLVALGLWTDGSGKRQILDWEVADKEEQATWERLVQRLWERGVKVETGLQAIVRDGIEGLEQALDYVYGSALVQQRCIFHKLRNVSNKCVGLDREGKSPGFRKLRWSIKLRAHQRRKPDSLHLPSTGEKRSHRPSPPLRGSLCKRSATIR